MPQNWERMVPHFGILKATTIQTWREYGRNRLSPEYKKQEMQIRK